MNGWKKVPIGDVVESPKTWNPSRSTSDEVFNYIDLSAVDQDSKLIVGAREVSCKEAPSRARQLVVKGDIIVSTVRPNLNGIAQVPENLDGATASTGFCILRPRSSLLDGRFLFHWVKFPAFIADMVNKATGASYPAVSDRIILESILPLPSLNEQKRIADVLDRAEALRAKRRAVLAQLDELTQSIFYDMFGDSVSNPMGWKRCSLKNCVDHIQIGPFGSLLHKEDYISGGIPLINPTHIEDGKIVPDLNQSVTVQKHAELQLYQLQQGDVIMGRRGEMGRCAIVGPEHNEMLCGTGSLFIRPDESKAIAMYLQATLSSESMRKHLEGFSLGATLPNLNRGIVGELAISLPPIELQKEFSHCIESIEKLKATYKSSLIEIDELFLSLQYRAFRGEL